jgi:hypothetical protein
MKTRIGPLWQNTPDCKAAQCKDRPLSAGPSTPRKASVARNPSNCISDLWHQTRQTQLELQEKQLKKVSPEWKNAASWHACHSNAHTGLNLLFCREFGPELAVPVVRGPLLPKALAKRTATLESKILRRTVHHLLPGISFHLSACHLRIHSSNRPSASTSLRTFIRQPSNQWHSHGDQFSHGCFGEFVSHDEL